MLEAKHHIKDSVFACDVLECVLGSHHWCFAKLHTIGIFLDHFSIFGEVLDEVGAGGIVFHASYCGEGETIGEAFSLGDECDDVLSESVNAHIKPISDDVFDFFTDCGIVMVEVGLFNCKEVEIILATFFIPLPAIAGESCHPVVGELFAVLALAGTPDIIILIFGVACCGLFEPFVLVAGVVDDKVHDDLHATSVCSVKNFLKLLVGAVLGVDVVVVCDVVAVVCLRRCIER